MSQAIAILIRSAHGPYGRHDGQLSAVASADLGAVAISAALQKSPGLGKTRYRRSTYGLCVLSAGLGQAPARQAAFAAGITQGTPVPRSIKSVARP